VVAQMEGEKVRVLDEIVLRRATTIQACEEFERRYPKHPAGLIIYADASGSKNQTSGTSDLAMLQQFFRSGAYGDVTFKIPPANPMVRDRVVLMNSKLASAEGARTLTVRSQCVELIKDFEQVTYKDRSQVIDKDKDGKRTHLSDALGYLLWQEFQGKASSLWRNQRLI
jgi:hypothetical protein